MRKILIFGESGSGKSTFASKLAKRMNIPHLNLDDVFWDNNPPHRPFSQKRSNDARIQMVHQFLNDNKEWIVEGIYCKDWINPIVEQASHIYYLNVNIFVRDYRIIKRDMRRILRIDKEKSGSIISLAKLIKFNHQNRAKRHRQLVEKVQQFNKKIRILS